MTVNPDDCVFESFVGPLGREYGVAEGREYPGIRVTHVPSGTVTESNNCPLEMHNREHALNKLTNEIASPPEQAALVDAMSWSNANCYFADGEYRTNNDIDHTIAADILDGLEHLGWKLVKVS